MAQSLKTNGESSLASGVECIEIDSMSDIDPAEDVIQLTKEAKADAEYQLEKQNESKKRSRDEDFYCIHCDVELSSETAMDDHLKGKKHLKNVQLYSTKQQSAGNWLKVSGYPALTMSNQLRSHFASFGTVKTVEMNQQQKFALIQMGDNDDLHSILVASHPFQSTLLDVQRKLYNEGKHESGKRKNKADATPLVSHASLMYDTSKCKDFDAAAQLMVDRLSLTIEDIEARDSVQNLLQTTFESFFPGCKVHQFGSSTSGLGRRGCDLDLVLDLNLDSPDISKLYESQSPRGSSARLPFTADLKSIKLNNSLFCADNLATATKEDLFQLLSRTLSACCRHKVTNIITLASARIPIVRFTHINTGLKCDISMNNRIVLRNTQLLQLYKSLDPRVAHLMYVLRFWAGCVDLCTGRAGGVNTYTLQMMVIFFLQNTIPKALPTVDELAKAAGEDGCCTTDGWDTSLPTDKSTVPAFFNSTDVATLIQEFMELYQFVDFENNVLSIRTGRTIPLQVFRESMEKDEKLKDFQIKAVNIQDPFVLNHNLGQTLNEKTIALFKTIFNDTASKFKEQSLSMWLEVDSWGIEHLCSNTRMAGDIPGFELIDAKIDDQGLVPGYDYSFSVSLPAHKVREAFFKLFKPTAELKLQWSTEVFNTFRKLLKECLRFETVLIRDNRDELKATLMPPSNDTPHMVIDEECGEQEATESFIHMRCHTTYRLWHGRAKTKRKRRNEEQQPVNSIENEIEITRRIMEKDVGGIGALMGFYLMVVYQNSATSTALHFHMKPALCEKDFSSFYDFIRPYFTKLVESYEFVNE